jgi:hypothetical protein
MNMQLSDYPCESLTFTGLGASGSSPQAAASRLASALNGWVARNRGRRLLQVTPVPAEAGDEAGLAVLLIHTAGSELTGELAEQVAAAVDDALEHAMAEEIDGPVGRQRRASGPIAE